MRNQSEPATASILPARSSCLITLRDHPQKRLFLSHRIVAFEPIRKFFFGGLARLNGDYKVVILAAGTLLLEWLVLYALYRRRLFLPV